MRRPSARVLEIWLNPPRFLTVPSLFNDMFDTFAPGLAKCGVLLTLIDSARIFELAAAPPPLAGGADHASVNR